MARLAPILFGLGLGLLAQASPAFAQSGALPDAEPKVNASLIAERTAVTPGGTVTVALRELIREKWHTYWVNPGDSGAPTIINWQLPEGWTAAAPQFPYPERIPVGPLMNFGYENEVVLLNEITAPANATPGETATLEADVMWLVCSDVCIPEETHLSLRLPVAADAPPPSAETSELFAAARAKLPHASPWKARYQASDARFGLLVEAPELASARPKSAVFYPYTDGMVQPAAPQSAGTASAGLVLQSAPGWKMTTEEKRAGVDNIRGILVLTGADGRVDALDLEAAPGPVPAAAVALAGDSDLGLLTAMLFAVLGGLILNLMPCVFPVLSMKALALAAKRDAPEKARALALAYGAGVLASFVGLAILLIALQAGGAAVGWGFQLQQPLFVTMLALLMFAVGLNLSGLYEVGGGALAGAGERLTHSPARPEASSPACWRSSSRRRAPRPSWARRWLRRPRTPLRAGDLPRARCRLCASVHAARHLPPFASRPAPPGALDDQPAPVPCLSHVRRRHLARLGVEPASRIGRPARGSRFSAGARLRPVGARPRAADGWLRPPGWPRHRCDRGSGGCCAHLLRGRVHAARHRRDASERGKCARLRALYGGAPRGAACRGVRSSSTRPPPGVSPVRQ
jgi:DsbC/DsbD-like thiol-disulfide interchange protein